MKIYICQGTEYSVTATIIHSVNFEREQSISPAFSHSPPMMIQHGMYGAPDALLALQRVQRYAAL